ncbi:hypothetical protein HPB49_003487 [Dermacentor silvarum]|uniref:Uncharacterized protein n=1 Tax=Dermacentor silvarum TaxID=543639 RepID=A0ACB8DTV2_DERSI|nr:hypothetical protein HPB49_003487 [Dermacentor silvarum]
MFALVRFVNEIDKTKRYIIPVKDTNDFYPLHLLDFDNKVTYSANWCDPNDEEDSGEYVVQILKLAVQRTMENLSQPCRCGNGCLAHWGSVNNVDTTLAHHNVMRTLSEKIQYCKKKLRMN